MSDFFKSRTFLVIVIVAVLSLAMGVASMAGGRSVDPLSNVAGVIVMPLQKLSASLQRGVGDFSRYFTDFERLHNENTELKDKVKELQGGLIELERYRLENERLRLLLDLKERRPDFKFAMAEVIAADLGNWFTSFTIDRGTLSGVKAGDPVITDDALVGFVVEAGLTWAKVNTILEPNVTVGAISARTRDIGIVEGRFEHRADGLCVMSYIPKNAAIIKGDTIETSGLGGAYPKGLIIGTVIEVELESHGLSRMALISPAADLSMLHDVFVVTSFGDVAGTVPDEAEADADAGIAP